MAQVKFRTLAPPVESSKNIYHCSHQPPIEAEKTLLCPSSLIVTELKNGYRVMYLKEHFGHPSFDEPLLKYKTNSILPFIKDIEIQHVDSDEHIHQQLKSIMNNIMVTAPKNDTSVLLSLLNKALEMTLILNSIGAEETKVTNKNLTDNQITEVLSEVRTYPGKRKVDTVKKDVKISKTNEENGDIKTDAVSKKTVDSLTLTPLKKTFVQSPSFNDSYKSFVDLNFKATTDTSTPKKSTIKKKAVVKTKIGQFKVKPSLSPKDSADTSPVKKPQDSPKMTNVTSSPKRGQYTNLVVKKISPTLSPKKMKPSLSPHVSKPTVSPKAKNTPIELVGYKIKPDFKYEVKEQENDCNILILKI